MEYDWRRTADGAAAGPAAAGAAQPLRRAGGRLLAGEPPPAAGARAPRGAAAVLRGSGFGRSLYRRRGKTVEPFFGRFKELFGLQGHVWHAGLGNNRTQLTAAVLLYQILLAYNRIKGRGDAEVKWILDLL